VNAFLGELGKQLAQKWLALLFIPGLLYVATAVCADAAGWADALNPRVSVARLNTEFAGRSSPSAAQVTVAIGTILLAATASGLAARALACIVETIWLGQWPRPFRRLGQHLTERRRSRWEALAPQGGDGRARREKDLELTVLRRTIGFYAPRHPTWMGDRLAAAAAAAEDEYQLNLPFAWPRLWLMVPTTVRDEVRAARTAFDQAVLLGAWAILYAVLGAWWWPALLIGAGTFATAWCQARARVVVFADVVESVVDLHFDALASAMAAEVSQETQRRRGHLLTLRLGKAR
jgi:hypothetical protein